MRIHEFETPLPGILDKDFIREPKINERTLGTTPLERYGFGPEELAVIGTHVAEGIVPGFKYRVRKNLTEEWLFGGRALRLQSVGVGYGKRITFEGDRLNGNEHFFWTDTHPHGYGFVLQALAPGDTFRIESGGRTLGRAVVRRATEDAELGTNVRPDEIRKEVRVRFECDVVLHDAHGQNVFVEKVPTSGVALVSRSPAQNAAVVKKIAVRDFIIDECHFLSEQ